jgi:exonuclease SbcD
MKILHFADAHIDIAAQGRHDPSSGLPVRVLDFLKSLDSIVDCAIQEKVDLVLFAGDAYKDRTPVPTFQREWGKRIKRLSQAGIPTLLLVGNHDLSPASGRAHALQEFETLQIPHIHAISKPTFLHPEDLEGLPLQILALPWVSRSGMMAALEMSASSLDEINAQLEERLTALVKMWLEQVDPSLPVVLAAHCSVQGARLGGERTIMLGSDLVLPRSLVCDPRLNYVALGHIHKAQDLNEGQQPPVIYPGSIERVDFGEVADDKFFVISQVSAGEATQVSWRKLDGRRFFDCALKIVSEEDIAGQIIAALPAQDAIKDAIVRLSIEYPRQWDTLLNETTVRQYAEPAFEFHLVRRPQMEARLRLPEDQAISSLQPAELLDLYWKSSQSQPEDLEALQQLAGQIIQKATLAGDV